ncbi:IclR family transcriptional regulator [Saccharopolyspora oryzae]|uniref:IclR family transcriptional regulator n=1 Tax=Saccharopolyspora oryzae TaxID=2997343 RepID=A0ABT4UWT9_9PSEU|nr:IclR family transcriptional regulator [Saccharopolyspora oryzae]MDA3626134.1 IclR family transcriptional regulator [Saccharopolyspora oryzae]
MCAAERNVPDVAVARVAAVLGAFDPQHAELRVSEIARRAGLPKSTTSRLVRDLVVHRFLERDGPALHLGARLFEFGELASRYRNLRSVTLPHMADLREATRQTVHLAVLDGTEVVYVEILRSKDAPRMPSRVGGRLPAHASALGKALLAFSEESTVEDLCAWPLRRVGPRSITAPGLLRQELKRIREAGLAYESEESSPGTGCVASPIIGADGMAAAALSISGWSGKLNLRRMAPAVRTAALAISRELRGPTPVEK